MRRLLLTLLNNKTGLVLPVAEIAALARRRGADVIVDAAHAWGQIDFKVLDLGPDFIGFNLHKWIGAPVGVGALYISKGRLRDVDPMMGDEDQPGDSILSRVHSGTVNFAAFLAVPAALDFHAAVGPSFKAARLRYLRDLWLRPPADSRASTCDARRPGDDGRDHVVPNSGSDLCGGESASRRRPPDALQPIDRCPHGVGAGRLRAGHAGTLQRSSGRRALGGGLERPFTGRRWKR